MFNLLKIKPAESGLKIRNIPSILPRSVLIVVQTS
jgi:hypothetical protein